MSVSDRETVDGIALTQDGKGLILLITDHLDWGNEYGHLIALQEKINDYITFCEDQQYQQIYKDNSIEYAIVEIHFKHEPTETAMKFLEQVQRQLVEMGMTIECHISEA